LTAVWFTSVIGDAVKAPCIGAVAVVKGHDDHRADTQKGAR